MSMIKSSEEPNARFAKLIALLFYHMSHEMCKQLGKEKGKEAIRNAVTAFGAARVAAMKEEAAERGLSVTSNQTFHLVRDMPNPGYDGYWEGDTHHISYCPFHDLWKSYGPEGMEYGELYCEVDHVIFSGFNLALKRDHVLTVTGDYCEFNVSPVKSKECSHESELAK